MKIKQEKGKNNQKVTLATPATIRTHAPLISLENTETLQSPLWDHGFDRRTVLHALLKSCEQYFSHIF